MLEDNEDFLEENFSIENVSLDDENSGLYEHLKITVDKKLNLKELISFY